MADAAPSHLPVPLITVLDTMERAQRHGPDAMARLWDFLDQLQRAHPLLHLVFAGRSPLGPPSRTLALPGLEPALAVEFLRHQLGTAEIRVDKEFLRSVTGRRGENPLSLRLAAEVIRREGQEGLRDDEDLRRITPDLIRQVLAVPCRLEALARGQALRTGDAPGFVETALLGARIAEDLAQFAEALRILDLARRAARALPTPVPLLRVDVAQLRAYRRSGAGRSREATALRIAVLEATDKLGRRERVFHPTLVRDLAAEVGKEMPELVSDTAPEHGDEWISALVKSYRVKADTPTFEPLRAEDIEPSSEGDPP